MVDQEVVDILAEIKQRVVSAKSSEPTTQHSTNGASPAQPTIPLAGNHDYAALTVLARSWDRLPPLVTNRTGTAAKIDLWIKAMLKKAFRWFTWEQINFNSGTLQTFRELIDSLSLQQQQLASIQQQLSTYEEHLQKLADRLVSAEDQNEQVRASFGDLRALIARQQADLNAKLETRASQSSSELDEVKKALAQLVRELRDSHEKILDDQRVSFKQLSLELTEAQVLQDRARRELDARVAKLES
jgi:hypothetical protein